MTAAELAALQAVCRAAGATVPRDVRDALALARRLVDGQHATNRNADAEVRAIRHELDEALRARHHAETEKDRAERNAQTERTARRGLHEARQMAEAELTRLRSAVHVGTVSYNTVEQAKQQAEAARDEARREMARLRAEVEAQQQLVVADRNALVAVRGELLDAQGEVVQANARVEDLQRQLDTERAAHRSTRSDLVTRANALLRTERARAAAAVQTETEMFRAQVEDLLAGAGSRVRDALDGPLLTDPSGRDSDEKEVEVPETGSGPS